MLCCEAHLLWIHLLSSLASDVFLVLSALISILYLRQDANLKRKKRIGSLPSLHKMDQFGLFLLFVAFVLMTLGMFAGSILAYQTWGPYWYLDPRQLWSVCVWLLFAFVLLARWQAGWRGRKAVFVSLSGSMAMLLGFFLLNYFHWSQHYGL